MDIVRLDDYQSWLLEFDTNEGERLRVLVDPWLSERFTLIGAWFFARHHRVWVDPAELPPIDVVLLSAHFVDHLDPATLAQLDPEVPVLTTKFAARRLRRLGRRRVEVLSPGVSRELAPGVELLPVRPGFPYAHNSLGFAVHEQRSGRRLYLETHVCDAARLAELAAKMGSIDVVLAPVESVHLFGIQFAMDAERALRSLRMLGPSWVLPTGIDPRRSRGLLARLLRVRGDVETFSETLAQAETAPKLVELEVGGRFRVPGGVSASAEPLPVRRAG